MKTLLHLKRMIALNRPGGMRELPALRLMCIDSDDLIRPSASPDQSIPVSELSLDPANEYLKLEIPGNVGYDDLDRAKTWFPRELEYFIPDLSTGCKQYKSLGRLLFAWNYGKFLKLVEPLRGMVDSKLLKKLGVHQVDDPLVFVVTSLCGGTGAGMFLDVSYTLTNLWKRKWNRFNTKVCGLLALPSVFSDVSQGTERIRSNAYASMKELDHFMNKDVYMDSELAFKTDYPYVEASETYNFAPFDRVFVFDNSNGRVNISSSQVYEMMARYIYLMVCGELAQDYNSIDNNLNPKIRGVNRMLNKPTCYSSFGYYSVVFPRSIAVQLAAAELALEVVEQELVTAAAERDLDKASDAFLTVSKVHFSNQSPQILHSLSFYSDSTGHRVNIQDTIGSTVSNIDLGSEPPENHEAILREYDTRFSTTDLALFEADSRREAAKLLRDFRTHLEAEIQKLADPAQNGSVRQVQLFVEALHRQVQEDVQAVENLSQQTEKQLPGLKSSLENQFLKLRQTASSRSLFSFVNVKKNMVALIGETREILENYWLQKRKAVVLRNALLILRGDPAAPEADLRTGALAAVARERESYLKKLAVLKELKERVLDIEKTRHSVTDGEFYKVAFDYHRDVAPVIEEVKVGKGGRDEARKKIHTEEVLGTDLDGLETLSLDESFRRLFQAAGERFLSVMDQSSLDERVTALGDLKTQIKTWLNFSRPFVVLDTVDASKYGFSEQHNAARFIAIPHTYAGKPCEQILNRCPVRSEAECDKYEKCLKRAILESLPEGTSVGHMAGRHEIHFLSLYHGFTASSLLHLISDASGIYRNHLLGHEKIHMFGPAKMYDLKEALPNKTLERLKDHFYLSFATGWIVWSPEKESFLFRSDADLKLNLPASVELGPDIGSILDNYHSPEAGLSGTVRAAFDSMARRLADRKENPRELGREAIAFVEKESSALDDQEKRRIFHLGQALSEGRWISL
jgi:hypothetical protein